MRPPGSKKADEEKKLERTLEQLCSAVAGENVSTDAAIVRMLLDRFQRTFTLDLQNDLAKLLHPDFRVQEPISIKCAEFVLAAAKILQVHGNISIESLINRLIQDAVLVGRPYSEQAIRTSQSIAFCVVGWLSHLWKADMAAAQGSLAVEPEEFSSGSLLLSSLSSFFAGRSVCEVLYNFGEILPMPQAQRTHHNLKVASLNAATLKNVGKLRIRWTESISAHMEFDAAMGTINLFRYPSLLALQTSQNSILFKILYHYYAEGRDPDQQFSTSRLSREIMQSYALLFRYDSRGRKVFRTEERSQAVVSGCLDPLLNELCLGPCRGSVFERHPQKESFDVGSDFILLGPRLMLIQEYIDGIQPNRISSLWRDKRDILRWYTFWAVLILGGLNLIVATVQTGLTAEQVRLARDALDAQLASAATAG